MDAAFAIHGAVEVAILCAACRSAEPRQLEKKQRCRSIDRRRCFVLCCGASHSVADVGASPSYTWRTSTPSMLAGVTVANCPPPGTTRSVGHEQWMANCGAVWRRSISGEETRRGKKNSFRGRREATASHRGHGGHRGRAVRGRRSSTRMEAPHFWGELRRRVQFPQPSRSFLRQGGLPIGRSTLCPLCPLCDAVVCSFALHAMPLCATARRPSPPSLLRAFPEKSLRCNAMRVWLLGKQRHRTEDTKSTEGKSLYAWRASTRRETQNL